jgi:N-glycosylase/DNA lyase
MITTSNKKNTTRIFVTKNHSSKKIETSKASADKSSRQIFESYLCKASELSLAATLDCGQCFRWKKDNSDLSELLKKNDKIRRKDNRNNCNDNYSANEMVSYLGVVCGLPIRVWNDGDSVWARGHGELNFWRDYFDLDRNYDEILSQFGHHAFTRAAINYGRGLRVLRQDAWEMLCSYVISQNNNIPKISSSISKLCVLCGERIEFDGVEFYSFPSADKILSLEKSELRRIGLGYRVDYVISAARAIVSGELKLDELKNLSTEESRERLLRIHGVGPKVANCVLLFGLGKLDAFPIDTWISKAAKYYDNDLEGSRFGQYAGIAQEYIFYYIRNLKEK